MSTISTLSASVPFRHPDKALGALGADVAARVVAAASDIALVLDRDGVVRDLSVNSSDLARSGFTEWLDRPWIETVTVESQHKVSEMLRDAAEGGASRWRELNHPGENGSPIPIRYFALDSGEEGRVIVVGRDLQSSAALQQRLIQVQQSVERDYLKLRQAESRYRLLFQTASEAVLIVEAATRRIREANPASARLTGVDETALVGKTLLALLDSASVEAAQQILNGALAAAMPASVSVRLADGQSCTLGASLFRQDRTASFLVRLTPEQAAPKGSEPAHQLSAVLERISDAFVVTDSELRILTVNPAFLDLTQLASREEAMDQPLDRYLGRPQIDLKIMLAQLRDHGSLRNFATVVRTPFGVTEDVEVSAVSVTEGEHPCFGFSLRNVSRRFQSGGDPTTVAGLGTTALGGPPRSIEQLTQLIGRVPMKEIVRESTDLIERLCIEAALTLTSNNRASAADMLGLSRQSLYSKLGRYGMGATDPAD